MARQRQEMLEAMETEIKAADEEAKKAKKIELKVLFL